MLVVDISKTKKRCPFIQHPSKACYCYEMNSSKVPNVLKYCNAEFNLCFVFNKLKKACKKCKGTCMKPSEVKADFINRDTSGFLSKEISLWKFSPVGEIYLSVAVALSFLFGVPVLAFLLIIWKQLTN